MRGDRVLGGCRACSFSFEIEKVKQAFLLVPIKSVSVWINGTVNGRGVEEEEEDDDNDEAEGKEGEHALDDKLHVFRTVGGKIVSRVFDAMSSGISGEGGGTSSTALSLEFGLSVRTCCFSAALAASLCSFRILSSSRSHNSRCCSSRLCSKSVFPFRCVRGMSQQRLTSRSTC